MSLLEPLIGSLLRRLRSDVHVFSDSLLSVGSHHWKRSMGDKDLRSKGPDDIHTPVRYHGPTSTIPLAHLFRPHNDQNHERNSNIH